MKRMTVILSATLAFLLAVGLAAGAVGARLQEASAEVVLKEACLFGDRRKADGFSVLLESTSTTAPPNHNQNEEFGGYLNWDTTYTFGEIPTTETEFWMDTSIDHAEYPYRPMLIDFNMDNALDTSPYIDELIEELKLEIPNVGDEIERSVYMADFIDTLFFDIDPAALDVVYDGESGGGDGSWFAIRATLAEKLTVPVDPSWQVRIILSHYSQDHYGMSYYMMKHPQIYSKHLNTSEATYIILQPRFSPFDEDIHYDSQPLGLFRLPRDPSKIGAAAYDAEGLSKLWESDSGQFAVDMQIEPASGHLLLLIHDGAQYSLLELNAETGEIYSESKLGYGPFYTMNGTDEPLPQFHVGENYAVLRLADSFLSLVERGEDGLMHETLTYSHDTEKSIFDPEHPAWITEQGLSLPEFTGHFLLTHKVQYPRVWYDYLDGRLAVYTQREMGCGFAVAIFEGGALVYHAQYASSLNADGLLGSYHCYPRTWWTSWYDY